MKRVLFCFLLYCGTLNAAEKTDILKIFEHFTLSSAAAGQCITPEESEMAAFMANYQMITMHSLQEIQRRQPDMTKEEVEAVLVNGDAKMTEAVQKVIEKEGCESPRVQDLIKRFHLQANWKP